MAHIVDDRAVHWRSIMGASGAGSEEGLEVDVIVSVRHILSVSIIFLRGNIDFMLKLPTSIFALGIKKNIGIKQLTNSLSFFLDEKCDGRTSNEN